MALYTTVDATVENLFDVTWTKDGSGIDNASYLEFALKFMHYVRDLPAGGRYIFLTYDGCRSYVSLKVLQNFR